MSANKDWIMEIKDRSAGGLNGAARPRLFTFFKSGQSIQGQDGTIQRLGGKGVIAMSHPRISKRSDSRDGQIESKTPESIGHVAFEKIFMHLLNKLT